MTYHVWSGTLSPAAITVFFTIMSDLLEEHLNEVFYYCPCVYGTELSSGLCVSEKCQCHTKLYNIKFSYAVLCLIA